jgi:DNA adenine methylase
VELAEVLHGCKGKVAISGCRCGLMDRMYKDWTRFDAPVKNCHSVKQPREEAVWMNYAWSELCP